MPHCFLFIYLLIFSNISSCLGRIRNWMQNIRCSITKSYAYVDYFIAQSIVREISNKLRKYWTVCVLCMVPSYVHVLEHRIGNGSVEKLARFPDLSSSLNLHCPFNLFDSSGTFSLGTTWFPIGDQTSSQESLNNSTQETSGRLFS